MEWLNKQFAWRKDTSYRIEKITPVQTTLEIRMTCYKIQSKTMRLLSSASSSFQCENGKTIFIFGIFCVPLF